MRRTFLSLALVLGTTVCALAEQQTLVSLHRDSVTPLEALKELGSQAGVTFQNWAGLEAVASAKLAVHADGALFWPTALSVADEAHLRFQPASLDAGERWVEILRGKDEARHPQFVGSPLVVCYEGSIPRAQESGTIESTLGAYADPAVRDFVFAEAVSITEATDASGKSLLVHDGKELPPPGGIITRHRIVLADPQGPIATLRGAFVLLQAEKVQPWTIANATAVTNAQKKVGRHTYTIESLKKQGSGYELKLHIKGPANGGFKAGAQDLVVGPTSLVLADAAGKSWRISDIKARYESKEITGLGTYDYTITLEPTRQNPGAIASFTWRIPLEISTVEMPFEFHNIQP